jgi:hypothetical protein
MDDKERLRLLADAASIVQARQRIRTNSGWYFSLAFLVLLLAVFRLPSTLGIAWLSCGVTVALAGLFGMIGNKIESVLIWRAGVSFAVALLSVYCWFRGIEPVSALFAVFSARLAITSLVGLRRYRAVACTPPNIQERVKSAFLKASRSDPLQTPDLVAMQRDTGLKLLLPNDDAQYDYRLLFDRDLVFLVGINSFLGLRYSPRIRFIAPSRTFHLDVTGESLRGKRNKVRLMLDNEPAHDTLEITPEMLVKARQLAAQHANNAKLGNERVQQL